MKKTVLNYGIIAGLISSSPFIGMIFLGRFSEGYFKNGAYYGYTLMIIAFALIFVATRITRDKYNAGFISFGKAFRVGFYISLIASTVYVITWLIDYYFIIPDFLEKYSSFSLQKLRAAGATEAEITSKTAEMATLSQMYKNPLLVILLTYAEILPVGIIVSLISAGILKKSKK